MDDKKISGKKDAFHIMTDHRNGLALTLYTFVIVNRNSLSLVYFDLADLRSSRAKP